jgi:sugar phosphate isomerase/epimerase
MKYAVFSVSVPVYTPEEAVTRLKEIGYDGIEWRVIDQEPTTKHPNFWAGNLATLPLSTLEQDAPKWKKLTEDAGLEIPGLGTYTGCNDLDAVDAAMRGAVAIGAPQLRINAPKYNGLDPFKPIWDTARAQYADVAKLAAKHGVKALIELHHGSIVPSASAGRMFLEGLDPVHVGVIHDAGNMVHEGYETHRLSLEILGPYLGHVHVKNARWFPEKYNPDGSVSWKCDWAPVHKGIIAIPALFTALHAIGYDGWIGLEDFSTEKPFEQRLTENLAYLKRVEAETRGSEASQTG